jgi:hypothetical protein
MIPLIAKLEAQLSEIYELDCFMAKRAKAGRRASATVLHGPATRESIDAREAGLGFRLPPSYREFLLLHNGWEHFWLNFTLSGVTGKHTECVRLKTKETIQWQCEALARQGYESPKDIEAWQKKARRNLFLANHFVIGTTFSGQFYVYDRRSQGRNGEMSLYYWTIEYGAWETDCTPDFHSFLKRISREAALHLGKLRRKKRP